MVFFPGPVEFLMGAPAGETEQDLDEKLSRFRIRIGRSFAIATKEVTVEQWERCPQQEQLRRLVFGDQEHKTRYYPDAACPHGLIEWYEAAAYCNWLSVQEGLPHYQLCYEPNQYGDFAEGIKPAKDYLDRTGYRLPTEAEWEYACRAGTTTSRYYGVSVGLLDRYAFYQVNSRDRTWAVASLKPNDRGLFDMLGNALEWTDSPNFVSSEDSPREDSPFERVVVDEDPRVLRGGSFDHRSQHVRSARRVGLDPSGRSVHIGFRVARTYR